MLQPRDMASKCATIYTARDRQIHEALCLTPLDTRQLLRMSETFDQRLGVRLFDQAGENRLTLTLGDRSQKPDHSFRLETRDGVYTYYDELDEATEPIASTKQRESLEAKIRFHEDYQNATGERYRVRVIFAKTSVRMVQFLSLARRHGTRQRSIFYGVFLEDYLKHGSPLTSPIFVDHFNRLQSMVPASASPYQSRLPTFAEMLAEPAAIC